MNGSRSVRTSILVLLLFFRGTVEAAPREADRRGLEVERERYRTELRAGPACG
jgi:hypothetical protein